MFNPTRGTVARFSQASCRFRNRTLDTTNHLLPIINPDASHSIFTQNFFSSLFFLTLLGIGVSFAMDFASTLSGRTCWVEMSEKDRIALFIGGEAGDRVHFEEDVQKGLDISRQGYVYELCGGRGRFQQFLIQFA